MDFELTEDQRILHDEIIKFARAELNEAVQERDEAHEFSRELWNKCGDMGLQGLAVPEEYGGVGLDSLSTAMALEVEGNIQGLSSARDSYKLPFSAYS